MDCAELSFGRGSNFAYQEFNLSPSGAWWSQGFARYREADPAFRRPQGVECYAQVQQIEPAYWQACLQAVPLTEIALPAFKVENAKKLRANVCFIWGADPQQFVMRPTWAQASLIFIGVRVSHRMLAAGS